MTTKSRFIAIMLISIMLLQSICVVSFAADDEATTEAKPETKTEEKAEEKPKEDIKYNFNQTALNLMMDLGVYDSTKDEDNAVKVTKAEFAELICKLTNVHDRVKDDKTSTFYMKDVLESHWANSFIQWVLGNGIMTLDDGNFEPERLVDTQTVITATINLLGRNFAVKLPGGVQRDIYFSDLKSGISKGFNEELMKGEIAQVFYNSLDLNMYEVIKYGEENEIAERKGVTILSQYRDVYKAKGIITGNEFTHLNGKSELESDQVEIDGDKYFFGNVDCSEYLGLAVEFYYKQLKNDEDKTLVSVLVNKENTITYIDSRDISSDTTNSRITFDKNGNILKRDISPNANVIVNNQFIERAINLPSDKFIIPNGDMTLIDNDKDGKVDLVKINTYKLGVVSGFNLAKETIGFKFGIPFVDLESKKYSIYKNDEKIKIEDLTQWDVTEVYESQDKESYTIKVLSKTVSGDVKGIQEEYTNANGEKVVKKATINDKVYTFSSEFETETGNKVQIGTKGTFTFDQYGQVIFLRNSGDTGESYGYVVGYSRSNGLMPKYDMKIFTARGEMDVLEVKDKLKVDGKNGKTAEYLEKVLKRVSEKPEGVNSIIKYAVNSEKKIVSVDTIEPNGAKPTSDELIKTKLDGLMRYASPANMLVSGNHNNRAVFDDNTVVFLIPDNPTSDSDYMVNSMKYFVNAAYYENLEVYDMTKNVVKVVKQKMTKKEGSYGNLDVSQSPLAIITDVATGLDAEGNEIKKLNIFVNNTESSVEIVEKTDIVQSLKEGGISKDVLKPEDLKVGDMIYYDPDLKNRANTIVRLNTDSMDKESFYITERASYTERAYGWLKEKNDGILELNIGEASTVLFNIAARNPKIYIYNLKKKSVSVGTKSDLIAGETVDSATKLYIRVRFGEIREIVIFE